MGHLTYQFLRLVAQFVGFCEVHTGEIGKFAEKRFTLGVKLCGKIYTQVFDPTYWLTTHSTCPSGKGSGLPITRY
jgi:hypothetical protein